MSIFNRNSKRSIETSVHNLSHNYQGTWFPGYIYPVMCTKVVPGDTFQIASNPFIRSQPFVTPLLTNVYCDIRYFYCRNPLLWENFDKYITNANKFGEGYLKGDAVPVHPFFTTNSLSRETLAVRELFDALYGATDNGGDGVSFEGLDALPARMYNLIFNEYYNNENYGKVAGYTVGDGQDSVSNYELRKGTWKKDYFTSSLPSPQRGETVNLDALVRFNAEANDQTFVGYNGNPLDEFGDSNHRGQLAVQHDPNGEVPDHLLMFKSGATYPTVFNDAFLDPGTSLGVNIDIRDLRKASAVQRFLEDSAVNGNRYAEYMLAHFGVRTPDNSSYRPQYLGGGSAPINYVAVDQTSQTGSTPQGTQSGKASLNGVMGMNHRYFFTEYGWIMALMVIRPEAVYAGGVNRQFWTNQDRLEDYYNPKFQNIGMQGVKRRELNVCVSTNDNLDDISYQERYMEYKYIPSTVHGRFLTDMASWVAIRDFTANNLSNTPVEINQAFMEVDSDVFDANTAVQNYPPFLGSIRHNVIVRRPMQYHAKYGGVI